MDQSTYQYLRPTDAQMEAMGEMRDAATRYSAIVESLVPDGPDKTYVIRKFREVAMWVNIAITRNTDGSPR